MASGSDCRADDQPPALPAKQHRLSSTESDCVGLQHHNYAYNDVFPGPTDCHAAQCPIHQRYDPFRHQARFFSDGTPPPVPKKRLARTFSLPGTSVPSHPPLSPLSPLSPLWPWQRRPQTFDNPLYMLAPIPDTYIHEETEGGIKTPVSFESFSQLSFDTPDEHLPYIFSSFVDHSVVSQGIQHRQLLFLRSMAQSVEASSLPQGESSEGDVTLYQPQDFLLREGSRPKMIGDMIYYSVHSPKFPGRELGLTVHKQPEEAFKYQPPHVNVQAVVAHFQPTDKLKSKTSTVQSPDVPAASQPPTSECTPSEPPAGGSTEGVVETLSMSTPTVQHFLQKGFSVQIERDRPRATLEDFVLHSAGCLDYDRQVCVLLLQALMGTHHLYNNRRTAAGLRPQEILLVWDRLQQGASEGRKGTNQGLQREEMEKKEGEGRLQMLWREQGSPRVVLKPTLSAHQPLKAIKHQIGALILCCLQPLDRNLDSLPSAPESLYKRALLHFSCLLQSDTGPQLTDMVALFQVLLWGPRVPLLTPTAAHNWLTIKRALLVMKMAERGLVQDESPLGWEDCLCLRYLSFTDPEMVVSVSGQLWDALITEQRL